MANQKKFIELTIIASTLFLLALNGFAQERRVKLRISNAGFTITALPLLAAKDWGLFTANGLHEDDFHIQSVGGEQSPVLGGEKRQGGDGKTGVGDSEFDTALLGKSV